MLPYTSEIYFALFGRYNVAIWPVQVGAYALGLAALVLVFRPYPWSGRAIGAVLALFWAWTGVAYHWLFFAQINFSAPLFAILFMIQAVLFVWRPVIRGDLEFRFRGDMGGWTGLVFMAIAFAVYLLLGGITGRGWAQAAMFGVSPSPVVLFTLGMLLLAHARPPWLLLSIPVLWCAIAAAAALVLGIPEDAVLAAAALIVVLLQLFRRPDPA